MTEVKVIIDGEEAVTHTSVKFSEIQDIINEKIKEWNNFFPEKEIVITLEKKEDADVLRVETSETVKSADLFGRP